MLLNISPLKTACPKLYKVTCTVLLCYFLLEILEGLVFEVYKALLHSLFSLFHLFLPPF